METHFLETLDWGILALYFIILFAIGIWTCFLLSIAYAGQV